MNTQDVGWRKPPIDATPSNIYFQVHVSVFHSKNKKVDIQLIWFFGKWCTMNKMTLLKLWCIRKHSIHVSYKQTLQQAYLWPVGHQEVVFASLKAVANK